MLCPKASSKSRRGTTASPTKTSSSATAGDSPSRPTTPDTGPPSPRGAKTTSRTTSPAIATAPIPSSSPATLSPSLGLCRWTATGRTLGFSTSTRLFYPICPITRLTDLGKLENDFYPLNCFAIMSNYFGKVLVGMRICCLGLGMVMWLNRHWWIGRTNQSLTRWNVAWRNSVVMVIFSWWFWKPIIGGVQDYLF